MQALLDRAPNRRFGAIFGQTSTPSPLLDVAVRISTWELSGSRARFSLQALVRGFRSNTLARFRPGELNLRAQSFRYRFGVALAARHAADVGRIASHLLRYAIVDASAKRRKTPQIGDLIGDLIVLHAVHRSSRVME